MEREGEGDIQIIVEVFGTNPEKPGNVTGVGWGTRHYRKKWKFQDRKIIEIGQNA